MRSQADQAAGLKRVLDMTTPGDHRRRVKHYHEPGDLHELTFSCYRPSSARSVTIPFGGISIGPATGLPGFWKGGRQNAGRAR